MIRHHEVICQMCFASVDFDLPMIFTLNLQRLLEQSINAEEELFQPKNKDETTRVLTQLRLVQQIQEPIGQIHHNLLVGQAAGDAVEGGAVAHGLAAGAFTLDGADALLFALGLDDGLEVGDELLPDFGDGHGDGDVDGGRVLQGVEVPALARHAVGDVVNVEVARGKGHDADEGAADDLQLRG